MSECVVRMEMPQNCMNCDLRYECNAFYAPGKPKPFMKGCRIVCQLPEGHGRLVDADSMEKEVCGGCVHGEHKYANCIDCALANAPTIVPAERSEK